MMKQLIYFFNDFFRKDCRFRLNVLTIKTYTTDLYIFIIFIYVSILSIICRLRE